MNKIISYLSKYLLGNRSNHSGNYTLLRALMSAAYLILITYCTLKDPSTRDTVIVTTGGLLTTLCGVHSIGSYFGSTPSVDTNPGTPD
jgi:hypothetical protein